MIERGHLYVSVDIAESEAPFRSGVVSRKLGIVVPVTISLSLSVGQGHPNG